MVNPDYTKEIGLSSNDRRVPWPVVLILLVAIVAAAWYGVSTYRAPPSESEAIRTK
jgi:hypothetical protein